MKHKAKIIISDSTRFHLALTKETIREFFPEIQPDIYISPQAFTEAVKNDEYDLALIDIDRPGFGNDEFISRLEAFCPEMQILAMTADNSEENIVKTLKAGAVDLINKTSCLGITLKSAIEQALEKRSSLIEAQRRLIQKNQAEKLNTITALVTTLKHEIKNPLMSILGNLELLQAECGSEHQEAAYKLKVIEDCARRIEYTIDRLSSPSRTEMIETPVGPMLRFSVHNDESLILQSDKTN